MNYLDIELNGIDEKGSEKIFKLSDFKGKNLIVYFYPKDGTPVCTNEAVQFRDSMEKLNNYAEIIGVSDNNIEEHKEFQQNYNLNFILLSDSKNNLKKAFESQNKYIINIHRATFILNKDGKIANFWNKVDIDGHVDEIIDYFQA